MIIYQRFTPFFINNGVSAEESFIEFYNGLNILNRKKNDHV